MKASKIYWSLAVAAGIMIAVTSCRQTPYVQGERLYKYWCANCHMEDGTGLVKVNPPLANSDYLRDNQAIIPCMIRQGIEGQMVVNGITYNQPMIAHPQLSEFEIANIINYINHAWGNDYGERSINEVTEWLEPCPKPY